jgi:hypothetical protein
MMLLQRVPHPGRDEPPSVRSAAQIRYFAPTSSGQRNYLYSLTFYSHRRGIYTRACPGDRVPGPPPYDCPALDLIGLRASEVSARRPVGSHPYARVRARLIKACPTPRRRSDLPPGPGSGASTASQTRPFASARRRTGGPGTSRAPGGAGFAKVWFARFARTCSPE